MTSRRARGDVLRAVMNLAYWRGRAEFIDGYRACDKPKDDEAAYQRSRVMWRRTDDEYRRVEKALTVFAQQVRADARKAFKRRTTKG